MFMYAKIGRLSHTLYAHHKFPFHRMRSEMRDHFGKRTPYGFLVYFADFTRYRSQPFSAEGIGKLLQCFRQPVWRLIKDHRPVFIDERFQSRLAPFFYRKKALETKPVAWEPRSNQCRHKSGRAG